MTELSAGAKELQAALRTAIEACEAEVENAKAIIRRAVAVDQDCGEGLPYGATVEAGWPSVGTLLVASAQRLTETASMLRRAEARQLRLEGMTMHEIAEVLGVTRQRVSVLLQTDARE